MKTYFFRNRRSGPVVVAVALALATALTAASPARAAPFSVLGWKDFVPTGANPVGAEIDVDPVRDLVYLSASFGGGSVIYRFGATNPGAMTLNTNLNPGWGSGIGVDPVTGRYASTNGYSSGAAVFNPDATMRGSTAISGCGGSVAAGASTFGVNTQCVDTFTIVDANGSTAFALGGIAVGSGLVYNPGNGDYYIDSNPAVSLGQVTGYRRVDEVTHAVTASSNVAFVVEANGAKNLVYAHDGLTLHTLDVISGSSDTILHQISGLTVTGDIAADIDLDRLYIAANNQILVYDAQGTAQLDSFALPGGFIPRRMEIEAGDGRLYVTGDNGGTHRLFVLQTQGVAEPATLVLLGLGFGGVGLVRRWRLRRFGGRNGTVA